jgi:hypothetical protein
MDLASSVCNLQAATSVLPKSARYSVVSPLESTIGTDALPSSRHAQVLQQDSESRVLVAHLPLKLDGRRRV